MILIFNDFRNCQRFSMIFTDSRLFSLILIDLNIPRRSGLDVLKYIADHEGNEIKDVIMKCSMMCQEVIMN